MTVGCLDETTVLAFLGGTLPHDARSAAERHIGECSACADLVTWAAAVGQASATGSPSDPGRPFVGQLQPGARSRYSRRTWTLPMKKSQEHSTASAKPALAREHRAMRFTSWRTRCASGNFPTPILH